MRSLKHFSIAVVLLFINAGSSFLKAQCSNSKPPTFTVHLPLVRTPPDEERQHWDRPDIWDGEPASDDEIVVPNGRPIYALIVSGYTSNTYFDQMMLYSFARYLMSKGAYVHYSWWNNLLAPYMERPLHSAQSDPGNIGITNLLNFRSGNAANKKAFPGEDYQFVSDAKRFLTAIRQNNPNAIIIVAGHSMGGGAVVHLANQTNELIDILAPIDPVGNRNFPWAGFRLGERDYNWTRWRASRDNFLGYKKTKNEGTFTDPDCQPTGEWLSEVPAPTSDDFRCLGDFKIDETAAPVRFGSNVVNLLHLYQQEAKFPYDYDKSYHFGHVGRRPNSISIQMPITTQSDGIDIFGWPDNMPPGLTCCPAQNGVGWPSDGHEEIIGNRGPTNYDLGIVPIPLGTRLSTSPQCGFHCTGLDWPARSFFFGWNDDNRALRVQKLKELETFTRIQVWPNAPTASQLCKVSDSLIDVFNRMNKPPTANAGNNLLAECNGNNNATVTLDGSASTDPDNDELGYTWSGSFGTRTGKITSVILPVGTHCITLTVEDPSGHIDKKKVSVTVQDKVGPVVNVSLTPSLLWPPNHKFVEINATVNAVDACGTVESIVLYSIVASEGANIVGSGNTSPDIIEANYNTHDLVFKLRAERSGPNRRRIYTVTYKATDNAGNSTLQSAEVVVENPSQ